MVYEIEFTKKAEKQFLKLEKDIQKRIISTLERIRIKPELHLTKLIDDPAYKLRVGNYRILIDLDRSRLLIMVIQIGHRKNIYKK